MSSDDDPAPEMLHGYSLPGGTLKAVGLVARRLSFENSLAEDILRAALLEAVKRTPRSGIGAVTRHREALRALARHILAIIGASR